MAHHPLSYPPAMLSPRQGSVAIPLLCPEASDPKSPTDRDRFGQVSVSMSVVSPTSRRRLRTKHHSRDLSIPSGPMDFGGKSNDDHKLPLHASSATLVTGATLVVTGALLVVTRS